MIGVRMNGLLNPPVAMITPTLTNNSMIVRRRTFSSDAAWSCCQLAKIAYSGQTAAGYAYINVIIPDP